MTEYLTAPFLSDQIGVFDNTAMGLQLPVFLKANDVKTASHGGEFNQIPLPGSILILKDQIIPPCDFHPQVLLEILYQSNR